MKDYRVLWNEPTELKLTAKAEKVLANTDPIEVRERKTEDGFLYDVRGCIEMTGLTEDDLNEIFESWEDEE